MKMQLIALKHSILLVCLQGGLCLCAQTVSVEKLPKTEANFPFDAKPWVSWQWMQGTISKQAITADLEAMQKSGVSGAYIVPIKDTNSEITVKIANRQAKSEWLAMINFAMQEAKRLNLQLAIHVSDGFAITGNALIKPEMSVQKLVWTKDFIKDGDTKEHKLEQPETVYGYYKDIAVYAYPANSRQAFSDTVQVPSVATSNGVRASFLCFTNDSKEIFKSDTTCWIQYKYSNLFTCRSVHIRAAGNNYSAQSISIQACNDGMHFKTILKIVPSQTNQHNPGNDYNYSIPITTARFFRFVYNKEDAAASATNTDMGKWKPSLQLAGIYLSDEPVINEYEAKNGSAWRELPVAKQQATDENAIPLKCIINLTDKMSSDGNLHWTAPAGNWVIIRIGHTSAGSTNVADAGKVLECDRFDPAAVKTQFNDWFNRTFEKSDRKLVKQVLKIFYADNPESINQNWSNVFATEFRKRRGYDLLPYLPAMTGVPVENNAASEKFLQDVRETIADLVNDNFYATLKKLAHKKGFTFTAEPLPPAMPMDGTVHYTKRPISSR
jgi:hypothetical protein